MRILCLERDIMLISIGIMLDSFKIMDGRDHIKKIATIDFFHSSEN